MVVFSSWMKLCARKLLLISCLSLLLVTTESLLSVQKLALSTLGKSQQRGRCLQKLATESNTFPVVLVAPSGTFRDTPAAFTSHTTTCNAKRDPFLDTATDADEDSFVLDEENDNNADSITENDRNTSVENNTNTNSSTPIPPPSFLSTFAVIVATILFVSFWPLLAFLRTTSSPLDGFDVDMFMALKGIIDTAPMTDTDPSIMELPSLSPAEQLVGSFFGPPRR